MQEQVRADGLEPLRIGETGQRELPQKLRFDLVVEIGIDLSFGIDRNRSGIVGNGDVGDNGVAIGRDDLTFGGALQPTVPRVGRDTGGKRDFEIPVALDCKVEIAARRCAGALLQRHRDGRRAHTKAELHASRKNGSVGCIDGAGSAGLLIMQVGKFCPARVVTRGTHVGEVV